MIKAIIITDHPSPGRLTCKDPQTIWTKTKGTDLFSTVNHLAKAMPKMKTSPARKILDRKGKPTSQIHWVLRTGCRTKMSRTVREVAA